MFRRPWRSQHYIRPRRLIGTAAGTLTAPTFHSLTSGGTTTDAASYLTESFAPAANRLVLISINCYMATGSVQPPQPTVTGNGITYDLVQAQDVDTLGTDRSTMWVFRGMNSAPTAGQITIDFGATTVGAIAWNVAQSSANVDTSGTNGSGAIVQAVGATSATTVSASPTVAFSPAMTAGNSAYFASGTQTAQAQTPRSGWVEIGDVSTVAICGLETQYINATDTGGSSTWTTAARAASILVEVKGGVASPNGYIAGHPSSLTTSVSALTGITHTTPVTGDLELLAWLMLNTATPTLDPLFASLADVTDTNLRGIIASNVSDGTETGDVSLSVDAPSANRQSGGLVTYRGYSGVAQVTNQPEANGTPQTVHSSPSLTPGTTGAANVLIYMDRVSSGTVTITPPSGYAKRIEFGTSGSGGTFFCIADKLSGLAAGTPESPGTWTASVASTSAIVFAVELMPTAVGGAQNAAAALTGTATISATASVAQAAAVSATTTATHTATATSAQVVSASQTAAASLTATATRAANAAATSTSTASVTAAATSAQGATAALTGTAAITAAATVGTAPILADATLTATGSRTATATSAQGTTAAQTVTAATTASATRTQPIAASLTVTSTATTSTSVSRPADTSSTATAGITATATVTRSATASLTVAAAATSVASKTTSATASLSVSVAVTVDGAVGAVATLTAAATATATAVRLAAATAAVTGTATVTASATATQAGTAALSGTATVTATATITRSVTASLTGVVVITAEAPVSVTIRPDIGMTPRPATGTTDRPTSGMTIRPSGRTPRPFTGTTIRP